MSEAEEKALPLFKRSKRHPVGDASTGPHAAEAYRFQHPGSRGCVSSLKKLDRAARIHNGDAPRRHGVPTRRERIAFKRAVAKRTEAR